MSYQSLGAASGSNMPLGSFELPRLSTSLVVSAAGSIALVGLASILYNMLKSRLALRRVAKKLGIVRESILVNIYRSE
jgi:hypothetical protein